MRNKRTTMMAVNHRPCVLLSVTITKFIYRVAQKLAHFVGLITFSNINQFSNFFSLSESGENF